MKDVRRRLVAFVLACVTASAPAQGVVQLQSTNGTAPSDPNLVGLYAMCAMSAVNGLPLFFSHGETYFQGVRTMAALKRHESLIGEHMALRGPLQILGFANGAVPQQGYPSEWNQQTVDWLTAGLVGDNLRLLLESGESWYVFPGRPGYGNYQRWKHVLVGANLDGQPSWLGTPFNLFNRLTVPVERWIEARPSVQSFYRNIGWGGINEAGDFQPPQGLSASEGHAWFQTRFHTTTLIGEAYRAYRIGEDYDIENGCGALFAFFVTPQVGAFGVSATQLIPIIGRINNIAHGRAGPESVQRFVTWGRAPARLLTYVGATGIYTWPQYDLVFSMMANVPNGEGFTESGMYKCIRDEGRPCMAGPTWTLYESTGGSLWSLAPVCTAAVLQLLTLACFKSYANVLLPHAGWGPWGPAVYEFEVR